MDIDVVKRKVVGLVGDGAFIRGNKPFKDELDALLGKKLTYRWDLLQQGSCSSQRYNQF